MADSRCRSIRIKTGVVKRIAREVSMYEKEVEQQRQKIDKMKSDGKDEYDIKKQEEVLQECIMMIPDCQKRLISSYEELKSLVETETDLEDTEEFKLAVSVLNDAQAQITS